MEEKFYYSSSKSAEVIKNLSYLLIFLSIIIGVVGAFITESIFLGIIIGVGCLIISIFIYGLGQVISLLNDIRENTEHLRDRIEGK